MKQMSTDYSQFFKKYVHHLCPVRHYERVVSMQTKLEECRLLYIYDKFSSDISWGLAPDTEACIKNINSEIDSLFNPSNIKKFGFITVMTNFWKSISSRKNVDGDINHVLKNYICNNDETNKGSFLSRDDHVVNAFTGISHGFSTNSYKIKDTQILPGLTGSSMCCYITIFYTLPITQLLVPSNTDTSLPQLDTVIRYIEFIDKVDKCINNIYASMKKPASSGNIDRDLFYTDEEIIKKDGSIFDHYSNIIKKVSTLKSDFYNIIANIDICGPLNHKYSKNINKLTKMSHLRHYIGEHINKYGTVSSSINHSISLIKEKIDKIHDFSADFQKQNHIDFAKLPPQVKKIMKDVAEHNIKICKDIKMEARTIYNIDNINKLKDKKFSFLDIRRDDYYYYLEDIVDKILPTDGLLKNIDNTLNILSRTINEINELKEIKIENDEVALILGKGYTWNFVIDELINGDVSYYDKLLICNKKIFINISNEIFYELNGMKREWYEEKYANNSMQTLFNSCIEEVLKDASKIINFYCYVNDELGNIWPKYDIKNTYRKELFKPQVKTYILEHVNEFHNIMSNENLRTCIIKMSKICESISQSVPFDKIHENHIAVKNIVTLRLELRDHEKSLQLSDRALDIGRPHFSADPNIASLLDIDRIVEEIDILVNFRKRDDVEKIFGVSWTDIISALYSGQSSVYLDFVDNRHTFNQITDAVNILQLMGFKTRGKQFTFDTLKKLNTDEYVQYAINKIVKICGDTSFLDRNLGATISNIDTKDSIWRDALRDAYNNIHTLLNYDPRYIKKLTFNVVGQNEFNQNIIPVFDDDFMLNLVTDGYNKGHKYLDVLHFTLIYGNYVRHEFDKYTTYCPVLKGTTSRDMYCPEVRNYVLSYLNDNMKNKIVSHDDDIILTQLAFRLINVLYGGQKYLNNYKPPASSIMYDAHYVSSIKENILLNYDTKYVPVHITHDNYTHINIITYIAVKMLTKIALAKKIYLDKSNTWVYTNKPVHIPILLNYYSKTSSGQISAPESIDIEIRDTFWGSTKDILSNPYIMNEILKNNKCKTIYKNVEICNIKKNGAISISIYINVPENDQVKSVKIYDINVIDTVAPQISYINYTGMDIVDIDKDNITSKAFMVSNGTINTTPIVNRNIIDTDILDRLSEITKKIDTEPFRCGNGSFSNILKLYTEPSPSFMGKPLDGFYNLLNKNCHFTEDTCISNTIVPNIMTSNKLHDNPNIGGLYSIMYKKTLDDLTTFMKSLFSKWHDTIIPLKNELPEKTVVIRTAEYINETLNEGGYIEWKTFISASNNVIIIDKSPVNIYFYIEFNPKECRKWLYIGKASCIPNEQETIFLPRQKFRINKIINEGTDEKIHNKQIYLSLVDNDILIGGGQVQTIHEWPIIHDDNRDQKGGKNDNEYKYKKYKAKYNSLRKIMKNMNLE